METKSKWQICLKVNLNKETFESYCDLYTAIPLERIIAICQSYFSRCLPCRFDLVVNPLPDDFALFRPSFNPMDAANSALIELSSIIINYVGYGHK